MKQLIVMLLFLFVIGCSSAGKQEQFDSESGIDDYSSSGSAETGGVDDSEGDIYGRSQEGKIEEGDVKSGGIDSSSIDSDRYGYTDDEELRDSSGYSGPGASSPFNSIYFAYDSYEIKSESVETLESVVSWMKNNINKSVVIEGHCDERGTNEYNLALGDKRASAVKDYLVISGISNNRITVLSYGEERPVCQEKNETCYHKNRRAYVVVSQ